MCGIAGLVGEISPANRQALRRMNDALAHRGPDGEGYWEAAPDAAGWGAMLAHRRLAILDLSEAAAQPMTDPRFANVVILNGEIYNFEELRASLGAEGADLESSGDTAAMLRYLSVNGLEALRGLRGMFALAFWDAGRQRLTLARDALGIKPLYITRNPDPRGTWAIAFASEVRALLASGLLVRPTLDPDALQAVVWNGFPVSPSTIVREVHSAWPGEAVSFDSRGRETTRARFWTRAPAGRGDSVTQSEARDALRQSVSLHLSSDVPLGVFLSGGIDSSAVANMAHAAASAPIHTFTLAFEEQRHNEGGFARQISAAIGTQHQEVMLTQQHFLDHLDEALDSLDQPTFDGINSWFMSRAVRDAGFKVALVGTGGDELFGGYTSFRDLPRARAWSRMVGWIPADARMAIARAALGGHRRPAHGVVPQTRWAKLPEMLRRSDDIVALYQISYGLFLPEFQAELINGSRIEAPLHLGLTAPMRNRLDEELQQRSPLAAISILEQRMFLGERLLRDTDAASMAASIEIRLPLVDAPLLEVVERLPDTQRFSPVRSKAMLRHIGLAGLDPALFDRPKQGFELPYDRWLRGALGDRIAETLRDGGPVRAAGLDPSAVARLWQAFIDGAPGLYWTRIWALYILIRWCQTHGVTVDAG